MAQEITITEGLSILKNVDARIQKEISNAKFITTYQVGKAPVGFKTVDDFVSKAKSAYQSINDLIVRRDKIKGAIVASNAVTKVTVAGVEYTVAAAIERKSSIKFRQNLLQTLVGQTSAALRQYEQEARQVQARLDSLLEQNFGKDSVKSNAADVEAISKGFMDRNEVKVSDPLDSKIKIDSLSREIDDFLTNVDVALSVSNATTKITID